MSGSYRVSKRLEFGAYRSVYYMDMRKNTTPTAAHEFDNTISARLDPFDHWYVKIEGHFIDGATTSPSAARGFYAFSNPAGIFPTTTLLVIRTGLSF